MKTPSYRATIYNMKYKNLNPIIKSFIIIVFLYGLTSASFNGFFGIYIKEIGHPESTVGQILSLRRFSVGISTFFIAFIATKIGHKKTLIMGLFTVGITSILIVLIKDLRFIQLISVIFGFGQAAMLTVESPFIFNQAEGEERVHAFSLTFAVRNAAFMTGSLVTGFLSDLFSVRASSNAQALRWALILVSLMSLIAIIPLTRLRPKPMANDRPLDLNQFKAFFTGQNITFLLYTGFIGLGAGMVVPFFGVYLKYTLNTTESLVGLILSFAQLGTVFGGLSVPWLSHRIGNYKTIILTQMLSIPLLIAIGFPQGIPVVAIAFFLRSSLMNMGQPLIRNIAMSIAREEHRPLMSAMRVMFNNLTRALGIYLGGRIMERYTYNTPYLFTIGAYIIGTLLFYLLFRQEIHGKALQDSKNLLVRDS